MTSAVNRTMTATMTMGAGPHGETDHDEHTEPHPC